MENVIASGGIDQRATLFLETWAGRIGYSVRVYGATPKRYRIEALENIPLPRRTLVFGDTVLVPKDAVKLEN